MAMITMDPIVAIQDMYTTTELLVEETEIENVFIHVFSLRLQNHKTMFIYVINLTNEIRW